jgi:hypothetical protein
MSEHYHTSIDHIILTTVAVVLTIHVGRVGAGWMVKSSTPGIQAIGKAVGAVLTFS